MAASGLFPADFQIALKGLVAVHHSIYARVPPQGIYFEALVENALRATRRPFTPIEAAARNQPTHDLLVLDTRLSLKTETGYGTHPTQINITKLCTTEREPWEPNVLLPRVMEHLSRYDLILMLRAIWTLPIVRYQLVEIPVELLGRMRAARLEPVGKRTGRQSLGADVLGNGGEPLFHVHFDGSDGKCQIRNLGIANCELLTTWDISVPV
jgi:hypothetical protein